MPGPGTEFFLGLSFDLNFFYSFFFCESSLDSPAEAVFLALIRDDSGDEFRSRLNDVYAVARGVNPSRPVFPELCGHYRVQYGEVGFSFGE